MKTLHALAIAAFISDPAIAQTISYTGPLSDYADILPPNATAGRNYTWGLTVACPAGSEPVSVACWINTVERATLVSNGSIRDEALGAYCLWRFGPKSSGIGRSGRITAVCAPSWSITRQTSP